jgi:hypothetical protein
MAASSAHPGEAVDRQFVEPGPAAAQRAAQVPTEPAAEPVRPVDCDAAWVAYLYCRLMGLEDCVKPDC